VDALGTIGWEIFDRFRIGDFAISPHGIGIAVGYLLGSWWLLRLGPKRGIREEHAGTMLLWALIGAIVGARAFFVAGHAGEFDGITDMLAVWRGGLTLIGGIIGAVLFAYVVMRKFGYRFAQVMDPAAIGLAFGIAVGRIGDLVIGDHFGKPTNFFLGFSYEGGELPGPWQFNEPTGEWVAGLADGKVEALSEQGARLFDSGGNLIQQGAGVHQTALYDLFIALALFALLWLLNRRPRREGVLISIFAIWYGAGRLFTDSLRVDKTWVIGLTGSQWAAVAAIVLAVGTLVWFALRPGRPAAAPRVDAMGPVTEFTPPPEPSADAPGAPPPPA
jgi:phosphatidylglycerol:prolipoprotein diacylglycerol transferase